MPHNPREVSMRKFFLVAIAAALATGITTTYVFSAEALERRSSQPPPAMKAPMDEKGAPIIPPRPTNEDWLTVALNQCGSNKGCLQGIVKRSIEIDQMWILSGFVNQALVFVEARKNVAEPELKDAYGALWQKFLEAKIAATQLTARLQSQPIREFGPSHGDK